MLVLNYNIKSNRDGENFLRGGAKEKNKFSICFQLFWSTLGQKLTITTQRNTK